METYLSPKELAQVIDASESSIKRWVDKGNIHADVTDGGHRKIAVDDAIRYIRQHRRTVNRADLLGFPDVNSLQDDLQSSYINANYYFDLLMEGNAAKARGYLVKLYLQGFAIAEICDRVVAECMSRIGELWQRNEAGICLEHHATDICIQAINALRMVFHAKKDAPVALGGAPEGDPYFIPSLCISTLLLSEGYRTINLGPNTPADSFVHAISQYQPEIVWISFSSHKQPRTVIKKLENFVETLNAKKVRVIIGGRASQHYSNFKNPNVFCGANTSQLAAFIQGIKQISPAK